MHLLDMWTVREILNVVFSDRKKTIWAVPIDNPFPTAISVNIIPQLPAWSTVTIAASVPAPTIAQPAAAIIPQHQSDVQLLQLF